MSRSDGDAAFGSARDAAPRPDYGETWVYESIVGAVPGIDLSARAAVAVQVVGFEAAVLALGWYYGLAAATIAGTVAVLVAGSGSAFMLALGARIRALPAPRSYRRLLFGSSVEVVLGVLAFVALVTYLFVLDPRWHPTTRIESLFGPRPPAPAVYLTLLVLWDLTYRIGVAWWACVAALWRSVRYPFDPETARGFVRVDALTLAFGVLQLALVPFVDDRPVLLAALVGHVVAVTVVSAASIGVLWGKTR